MRIALLSDTHLSNRREQLPDALLSQLTGVDAILHAGDLTSPHVLDTLAEIAPVTAVAGNADPPETARNLPDRQLLSLAGRMIDLKHGHQSHGVQSHYIGQPYDAHEMEVFYQLMSSQLPGADIIVFGHFHRAVIREWQGITFINPGAVSGSRSQPSFAMLELSETVSARIIPLPAS